MSHISQLEGSFGVRFHLLIFPRKDSLSDKMTRSSNEKKVVCCMNHIMEYRRRVSWIKPSTPSVQTTLLLVLHCQSLLKSCYQHFIDNKPGDSVTVQQKDATRWAPARYK